MLTKSVVLVLVCAVAAVSATGTVVGPACPSYYNPFCCRGVFVGGVCQCWSIQTFGPNCNYDCRVDLCNNHGVCDDNSNPVVDATGNIVSGTCVCDASGEWWGARCTANSANPTCTDGVRNGAESGVDCGGGTCPKCGGGKDCTQNSDCISGHCDNGSCTDATCNDGTKNGAESDVDCGGGTCPKCTDGKTCNANSDCLSGQCFGGICVGDNQPPVWTAPQPSATSTDKNINVLLRMNEAGTVYIVLVAAGASAPTVANVVAGKAAGGASPIAAAAVLLPDPSLVVTYQIVATLPASTAYDIYLVAADDRSPPNFQVAVTKVSISTKASDVYPPEFWVLFPRIQATTDTSVTFETALNEPGVVYFVVVTPSTAKPTAAAIKAGSVANVAAGSIAVTSAWTAINKLVSGLAVNTKYKAYFAAEDSLGQLQSIVLTLTFTTTTDKTPPTFVPPTPTISGQSTQGFTVTVMLNEPGWFYCVVLPLGAPAPTSLHVVQGVDGNGTAAKAQTATKVDAANTNVAVSIGDLQDSTTYAVYIVAADLLINVQASPVMRTATTTADTTPPGYVPGYPTITAVTSHSATVTVQLNEPGICYAVTVLRGTTAPTVGQVRTGYSGTAVSATTVSVPKSSTTYFNVMAGLTASKNYTAYIVCEDDSSPANLQTTATVINFNTPADTFAPSFVPPSPSIIGVSDVTVTMEVVLDDPGSVFYVIVLNTAAAPTKQEVLAGTAAGGAAAVTAGSFAVSTVLVKTSKVATGLTKLTHYTVYLVTNDAAGNSNAPVALNFVTTDSNDVTPPAYRPTYPKLHSTTTTTTTLAVRLTEEGQVFYIVTAGNSTSVATPTSLQVIAAQTAGGGSPITSGSMVVTAASVTFSEVITSLTPDTPYTVWIVARDNVPNVGEVVPIDFRTLPDGSCVDSVKNQAETDVDCGGAACPKCANGKHCAVNTDCASGVCASGTCVASTCEDGVKDNGETDVDCGGPCTTKCANTKNCTVNADCVSGNCDGGVCKAAACTPCAADEITVTACSGAVLAVCKVKAPVITEQLATATKTVVNIAPTTSGSYIVASRDCRVPSCSASSTSTTFDDAGTVKLIKTATGADATFNLMESSLIRAVSCKAGVQDSDVVTTVVKVNNATVKVFASTTLYIRALADFTTTRRGAFITSVATVATLAEADITIESAVANAASPADSTDVVYSVRIASDDATTALNACNALKTVLANVENNGNLRNEFVARDVVSNGGGSNQPAGQETNTPAVFDFTGGVAWLWWLIPLLLLLIICCLCCCCWLRRKERERYHEHDSFRGDVVIRSNQVSPAPSVSSADGMAEDVAILGAAPVARHTGNSRRIDDDDDLVGGAGGAGSDDDDDDGEEMMDLSAAVQKGEVITDTIETKGDTVVAYTSEGTATTVVTSQLSRGGSMMSMGGSRPGSAYADGSRPVGVDDLNSLNIRALSFSRTPGMAQQQSLSRHSSAHSSRSAASGMRVWAGNA